MSTDTKRSLLRLIFLTPAFSGLLTSGIAGQTPCMPGTGVLTDIHIDCRNCVIGGDDPHDARFSTEPRISRVTPGTSAAKVLRVGDVLVNVNGSLITTSEGARKFSTLKSGQNVVFMVRRNGTFIPARFTVTKCTSAVRAPTASPRAIPGTAASASPSGRLRGANPARVPPSVSTARVSGPAGALAAVSQEPRALFGFGLSCTDCIQYRRSRGTDSPIIWEFQSPPEVYSVETNGPAYRAGLRRGDLITHIDGLQITREEAGRRFGSAEPGQTVRFTYRRGNTNRTISVKAEGRPGVAYHGPEAEASLRRARELLEEIGRRERSEQALIAREFDRLRQSDQAAHRETLEHYLRDQEDQYRKLRDAGAQLAELESRFRREVLNATTRSRPEPAVATPPSPANRTIRYSGRLGNTDVEVRGGANVVVNETEDEIVITTGDATIRLKKRL